MDLFDGTDAATVVPGTADWVGPDLWAALAEHPLDCVETAFPHHRGAAESPEDTLDPRDRHPIFHGCYDWHSAVHGHWALVRGLRLAGDHPEAAAIESTIADRFTAENAEREAAYLADNPAFEKPYGWGWLLRLAAELRLWDDPRADEWRDALAPLEAEVRDLVATELLPADRVSRVGTHGNTAFGLACVHDYARVAGDDDLAAETAATARRHFGGDTDYPLTYEPYGWDFHSPGLTEADLMRRVLDESAFVEWFEGFLPGLADPDGDPPLDPVDVAPDPEEGVALHLVGLNLARAWCLAGLADTLEGRPCAARLRGLAERHAERGVAPAFTDDYAGAHWLSSFVLFVLTRRDGGIAPGEG